MTSIVQGVRISQLWNHVSGKELGDLYKTLAPTAELIADRLSPDIKSTADRSVNTWLYPYLNNTPHLKEFLQFVTGSNSMSNDPIQVNYFHTSLEPMPRAQTCFRILSIPKNFVNYSQFEIERNFNELSNELSSKGMCLPDRVQRLPTNGDEEIQRTNWEEQL